MYSTRHPVHSTLHFIFLHVSMSWVNKPNDSFWIIHQHLVLFGKSRWPNRKWNNLTGRYYLIENASKWWKNYFGIEKCCLADFTYFSLISVSVMLCILILGSDYLYFGVQHLKHCVLYVSTSVGTHCVHSWATSQSINLVFFLCLLPSGILTFGWRGTPLSSLPIWRWKFLEKRSPTTPLTYTLEKFMVSMEPFQQYHIHTLAHVSTSTHALDCCHGKLLPPIVFVKCFWRCWGILYRSCEEESN